MILFHLKPVIDTNKEIIIAGEAASDKRLHKSSDWLWTIINQKVTGDIEIVKFLSSVAQDT